MTYALELVHNLAAFGLKLHTVGKMLPAAAPAYAEMRAKRHHSVLRGLHESLDAAFHIVLLPFQNPHVCHITRHSIIYKHHPPVGSVGYRLSFSGYRFYLQGLKDKVRFIVSSHFFFAFMA